MKRILLALLLFAPALFTAQSFSWVKTPPVTFNMNPEYIGYTTAVDGSGNVYFSGFKDEAFPYDTILGNVYYNKYDASGALLFSKIIGGHVTVFNMMADHDGNMLVAFAYVGSISFDTLTFLTVSQDVQPLLVKFSPDGNMIWYYQPAIGESVAAQFRAIDIDDQNNIYIGYDDFLASYITKLTPNGVSSMTITQENVRSLTSLSVDNEGNIYSAGSCAEWNAKYAGVDMPAPFGYNTYIAKYNAAGTYQWMKYVEDVTCPQPQVKAFSPDIVYYSSYLFGPFMFDAIQAEGPVDSFGFSDAFITKLNASGEFQWVREVPGAGQLSQGGRNFLDLDPEGNLYFAGRTRGTISWNENIMTSTSGFNNDAIVLKYSPAGDVAMVATAGGESEDRFDSVAVSASGAIYLSGMCTGDASFGGIAHNAPEFSYYPFLTKVEQTLATENNMQQHFTIYPNPVSDYLHVSGVTGSISGTMHNVLGMKVKQFEISEASPVDMRDLSTGLYFVNIGNTTIKIIRGQ
jgi:hypothetical protein